MQHKNPQELDDQLHFVFAGFQNSSKQKQDIKNFILTDQRIKKQKNDAAVIPIENKYFSSRIGVEFLKSEKEFLAQFAQSPKRVNFVMIVENPLVLKQIAAKETKLRDIVFTGERNPSGFRSIWLAGGRETLDLSKFYEEFDCFVHIAGLKGYNQFQNEENEEVLNEFFEDIQNFTWNHQPKNKSKKSEPKQTEKENFALKQNLQNERIDEKPAKNESNQESKDFLGGFPDKNAMEKFEELDSQFMDMFDKILNFNQQKMSLQPEQRKEEASNLILKLMDVLGQSDGNFMEELPKDEK